MPAARRAALLAHAASLAAALALAALAAPGPAAAQERAGPAPRLSLPAASAIVARRDSFVARTAVGPVGWMRIVVVRTADGGVTVSETIEIEDEVELVTVSALTSRLGLRRYRQAGMVGGQPRFADLVRRGDRLQGTIVAPDGTVATVDDPAPEAPDPTALLALTPAMALAPGASGRVTVVVPGGTGLDSADVVVEGREPVRDPGAGDAPWRVRVATGGVVTRLVVTDALPRRVVALRTEGRPWHFERVER